jgi:hypothetical protein
MKMPHVLCSLLISFYIQPMVHCYTAGAQLLKLLQDNS